MFNMKTHVSIKLVNIISKTPRQNHHPPTRPITKKPFFFEVDNDMEADTHTRVQAMVGGDTHQQSTLILSIDAALLDPGHASSSIRHFIRDMLAGAPHPPLSQRSTQPPIGFSLILPAPIHVCLIRYL